MRVLIHGAPNTCLHPGISVGKCSVSYGSRQMLHVRGWRLRTNSSLVGIVAGRVEILSNGLWL
jgi:hypothetical protein